MEVKVIVSVDDRTANLIENLTKAIAGNVKKGIEIPKVKEAEAEEAEEIKEAEETKKEVKNTKTVKNKKAVEEDEDDTEEEEEKKPAPKKEQTKKTTKVESKYSVDDIRALFTKAKHAGHLSEAKAILADLGVGLVSDINPADYDNVVNELNNILNYEESTDEIPF